MKSSVGPTFKPALAEPRPTIMAQPPPDSAEFPHGRGGPVEGFPKGPPLLDRSKTTIEGLAFLGLALARNHADQPMSHPGSVSRQTQFDFNRIQDRDYKYFVATNDDGWLCGGGENGDSYKLANPDSAHCEIIRLGNFNEAWGGVSRERIREVMGSIMIPHIAVTPSFVLKNGDKPPELELKFDLEPSACEIDTWANWQLRFIHNQLFEKLQFPARFCPGPHHMTFVRKAAWRSAEHFRQYFSDVHDVVAEWRSQGPTLLEPEKDPAAAGHPTGPNLIGEELSAPHGVYLFKTRNEIVEYFPPNFHPPCVQDAHDGNLPSALPLRLFVLLVRFVLQSACTCRTSQVRHARKTTDHPGCSGERVALTHPLVASGPSCAAATIPVNYRSYCCPM